LHDEWFAAKKSVVASLNATVRQQQEELEAMRRWKRQYFPDYQPDAYSPVEELEEQKADICQDAYAEDPSSYLQGNGSAAFDTLEPTFEQQTSAQQRDVVHSWLLEAGGMVQLVREGNVLGYEVIDESGTISGSGTINTLDYLSTEECIADLMTCSIQVDEFGTIHFSRPQTVSASVEPISQEEPGECFIRQRIHSMEPNGMIGYRMTLEDGSVWDLQYLASLVSARQWGPGNEVVVSKNGTTFSIYHYQLQNATTQKRVSGNLVSAPEEIAKQYENLQILSRTWF
jgi:hypothetical protein